MNTSTSKEVRRTLQLCCELEREMGDLYRDFAGLHADDVELARLWLKTAREEDNHAKQFELALLYREEIAATSISPSEAGALLAAAREKRQGAVDSAPSPEQALRFAIELEERFASFHMTAVGIFKTPKLKGLFESMMAADRDHVGALEGALRNRS